MAQETLKVSEKDLSSASHADLLKIVINQKKAELDDMNHKVLLAKNNLRSIEESCKRTQSEFNAKIAVEKQEIERLKVKGLNEYAQQEERNQQAVRRLNEREMRLQEKEGTQAKLEVERKALYEQRVELEKVTRNSEEELNRTLALQSEAENKINQASQKEAVADKKLTEAKQLNSSAEYQFGQAKELEKKSKLDLENVQKIREETTPKIAELQTLVKKNEKLLAEAKEKEANANAKVEENSRMIADMKKQTEVLKAKELELATREEEIIRQEIVIKKLKDK